MSRENCTLESRNDWQDFMKDADDDIDGFNTFKFKLIEPHKLQSLTKSWETLGVSLGGLPKTSEYKEVYPVGFNMSETPWRYPGHHKLQQETPLPCVLEHKSYHFSWWCMENHKHKEILKISLTFLFHGTPVWKSWLHCRVFFMPLKATFHNILVMPQRGSCCQVFGRLCSLALQMTLAGIYVPKA